MNDVQIFSFDEEFPEHFYYQVMAFERIVWGEGDEYDIDLGLHEPVTHLVVADGKGLISYASIVYTVLTIGGNSYECRGLGSVMTFPHFRRRGYGSQIVATATRLMRDDVNADIGLLWAEPANHRLYHKHGWQLMSNLVTLQGDFSSPEIYDDEPALMLFLSTLAQPADFETARVYVGEEKW